MLRSPIFTRTFGNIEINIWSYPKEIVKCLLRGLNSNLKCHDKILNVLRFRHCYYKNYGGCNCNEKVEEISFKFSIKTHRQGNIFIPIEISDCESNCQRVFISELRSIPVPCGNRDPNAINIVGGSGSKCSCLLRLPIDQSNSGVSKFVKDNEKNNDTEKLKLQLEKMIGSLSLEKYDSKKTSCLDKQRILELCLENDISSDKIVSLLKGLKCSKGNDSKRCPKNFSCDNDDNGKKDNIQCRSVGTDDDKICCACNVPLEHLRVKNYKVVRTPSPQYQNYMRHDHPEYLRKICTPSRFKSSPKLNPMTKSNDNSHWNCTQDINDIKAVLNDLITKINVNDVVNCKSMRTSECCATKECCDGDKTINSDEILKLILQYVSDCKKESCEENNMKTNHCHGMCKQDIDVKEIPVISGLFDQTYGAVKNHEIPIIKGPFDHACERLINKEIPIIKNHCDSSFNCQSKSNIPIIGIYCDKDNEKEIPLILRNSDQIYDVIPKTIPFVSNMKDPIAKNISESGNENVKTVRIPSSQCCPASNESQNKAIKNALEVAGIPIGLSEYISKLTPDEFHNGLTNIYYYVNSTTGDVTVRPLKKKSRSLNKLDYVIEQQITRKGSDCEVNIPDGYSHIIVDINIQQPCESEILEDNQIKPDDNAGGSFLSVKSLRAKESNETVDERTGKGSTHSGSIRHYKSTVRPSSTKNFNANQGSVKRDNKVRHSKTSVQFSGEDDM